MQWFEKHTLFGSSPVAAGSGVGCIFRVSGGSAVSRPIKLFRFILGEHTDTFLFKVAVELIYTRYSKGLNYEYESG